MLNGDGVEAGQILVSLDLVFRPVLGHIVHRHVVGWSDYVEGSDPAPLLVLCSCSASSGVVLLGPIHPVLRLVLDIAGFPQLVVDRLQLALDLVDYLQVALNLIQLTMA